VDKSDGTDGHRQISLQVIHFIKLGVNAVTVFEVFLPPLNIILDAYSDKMCTAFVALSKGPSLTEKCTRRLPVMLVIDAC
jgi:hypothetical protein